MIRKIIEWLFGKKSNVENKMKLNLFPTFFNYGFNTYVTHKNLSDKSLVLPWAKSIDLFKTKLSFIIAKEKDISFEDALTYISERIETYDDLIYKSLMSIVNSVEFKHYGAFVVKRVSMVTVIPIFTIKNFYIKISKNVENKFVIGSLNFAMLANSDYDGDYFELMLVTNYYTVRGN